MARKRNSQPPPPPPSESESQPPGGSGGRQKRGRCPRCGLEFVYTRIAEHKAFPFCSSRCRDVDLGNWLSGNYVIPGQETPKDATSENSSDVDELDDGT